MSQQINLYEVRLRPRRELATGRNLGVAAMILLAVVAGTAVWAGAMAGRKAEAASALQKQVGEQQQQLAALSRAIAEQRVSPALAAELDKARTTLAARAEVVEHLDSGRHGSTAGFSDVFRGFARQAQPNLWLTGFVVARGGEDIEIRGRALDASLLPTYVQRLGDEPAFRGRRFSGMEMLDKEQIDERVETAGKAAEATAPAQPAVRPPRFVEFVLRSDYVGGKAESVAPARRGGAR